MEVIDSSIDGTGLLFGVLLTGALLSQSSLVFSRTRLVSRSAATAAVFQIKVENTGVTAFRVEGCTFESAGPKALSLAASLDVGAVYTIKNNSFTSTYLAAANESPSGSVVMLDGATVGQGSALVIEGNTFGQASDYGYVLAAENAGGQIVFAADNKCHTTGSFRLNYGAVGAAESANDVHIANFFDFFQIVIEARATTAGNTAMVNSALRIAGTSTFSSLSVQLGYSSNVTVAIENTTVRGGIGSTATLGFALCTGCRLSIDGLASSGGVFAKLGLTARLLRSSLLIANVTAPQIAIMTSAENSELVLSGATVITDVAATAIALDGQTFSNSSLLVEGCTVRTSRGIALYSTMVVGPSSVHRFVSNILVAECALVVCSDENGRALAIAPSAVSTGNGGGFVEIVGNTLAIGALASDWRASIGLAMLVYAHGIAVSIADSNVLRGGSFVGEFNTPSAGLPTAAIASTLQFSNSFFRTFTVWCEIGIFCKGLAVFLMNTTVLFGTSVQLGTSAGGVTGGALTIGGASVLGALLKSAALDGTALLVTFGVCTSCFITVHNVTFGGSAAAVDAEAITFQGTSLNSGAFLASDVASQWPFCLDFGTATNAAITIRSVVINVTAPPPYSKLVAGLQFGDLLASIPVTWALSKITVTDCVVRTVTPAALSILASITAGARVSVMRNTLTTSHNDASETATQRGALYFTRQYLKNSELLVDGNTLSVATPASYVFRAASFGGHIFYGGGNACSSTGIFYLLFSGSVAGSTALHIRNHTNLAAITMLQAIPRSLGEGMCIVIEGCNVLTSADLNIAAGYNATVILARNTFRDPLSMLASSDCRNCYVSIHNNTFGGRVSLFGGSMSTFTGSTLLISDNTMSTYGLSLLSVEVSAASVVSIGPNNRIVGQLFVSTSSYTSSFLFIVGNDVGPLSEQQVRLWQIVGQTTLITVADNTVRTTGGNAATIDYCHHVDSLFLISNNTFISSPTASQLNTFVFMDDVSISVATIGTFIIFTGNTFVALGIPAVSSQSTLSLTAIHERVLHDASNTHVNGGVIASFTKAREMGNAFTLSCSAALPDGRPRFSPQAATAAGWPVGVKARLAFGLRYEKYAMGSVSGEHIAIEDCDMGNNEVAITVGYTANTDEAALVVAGLISYSKTVISVRNSAMRSLRINTGPLTHSRLLVWRSNFTGALSLFENAVVSANLTANVTVLITECIGITIEMQPTIARCPQHLPCLLMVSDNKLEVAMGHQSAIIGFGGFYSDGVHIAVINNRLKTLSPSTSGGILFTPNTLAGAVNITIGANSLNSAVTVYGLEFQQRGASTTGTVEVWGNFFEGPMLLNAGPELTHMNVVMNTAASYDVAGLVTVRSGLAMSTRRFFACNRDSFDVVIALNVNSMRTLTCDNSNRVARCPKPLVPIYDLKPDDSYFLEFRTVTTEFEMCRDTADRRTAALSQPVRDASAAVRSAFVLNAAEAIGLWAIAAPQRSMAAFEALIGFAPTEESDTASDVAMQCVRDGVGTAADWARVVAVTYGTSSSPEAPPFAMADLTPAERPKRLACLAAAALPPPRRPRTATASPTMSNATYMMTASLTPPPIITITPTNNVTPSASSVVTPSASSVVTLSATAGITPSDSTLITPSSTAEGAPSATPALATPSQATKEITDSEAASQSRSVRPNPSATPAKPPRPDDDATQTPTATITRRYFAPIAPTPVKDALHAVSGAVGIATAVSGVLSATGGQLGVANAMVRLASCDDEDDDDDDDVPVLVHPLRFSLGGKGATGAYTAAAVSNTLIIPAVVALLARFPLCLFLVHVRGFSHRRALVTIGYPAVGMTPFLTLAEGTGVSIVQSLRSGTPQGIAFGLMGLAATAVFVAAWVRVMLKLLPRHRLCLTVNPEGNELKKSGLLRFVVPTRLWEPREGEGSEETDGDGEGEGGRGKGMETKEVDPSGSAVLQSPLLTNADREGSEMSDLPIATASAELLPSASNDTEHRSRALRQKEAKKLFSEECERYGKVFGDKRLIYAEIASFGCSLLVGVCEGVPATLCVERAAVAVVATTAQAVLECLTLVSAECLLQLVMAAFVIPMSVGVLAMAAVGPPDAPTWLSEGVDVLSLLANLVGMALLVVTLGTGGLEMLTERPKHASASGRGARRAAMRRSSALTLSDDDRGSFDSITPAAAHAGDPAAGVGGISVYSGDSDWLDIGARQGSSSGHATPILHPSGRVGSIDSDLDITTNVNAASRRHARGETAASVAVESVADQRIRQAPSGGFFRQTPSLSVGDFPSGDPVVPALAATAVHRPPPGDNAPPLSTRRGAEASSNGDGAATASSSWGTLRPRRPPARAAGGTLGGAGFGVTHFGDNADEDEEDAIRRLVSECFDKSNPHS